MSNRITPNEFRKAINDLLDEYGDEVANVMESTIKEVAKDATKELRNSGSFNNITGKYRRSWSNVVTVENLTVKARVYAKSPEYRLTHLLEFGHAKQNGGRTKAFPHIEPVNRWVGDEVISRLENKLK